MKKHCSTFKGCSITIRGSGLENGCCYSLNSNPIVAGRKTNEFLVTARSRIFNMIL